MNIKPSEQDIVFCMEDCDNEDCPKNRYRVIMCRPHNFAYLRNTEYCPLNNIEKMEENS